MSRTDFRALFTQAETVAIYTAAQTSPAMRAWLDDLICADMVETSNPATIAGVQAVEAAGLIAPGRANQILGIANGGAPIGGFAVGQLVRVLPPFDAAFPDAYPIEGFSPASVQIAGGVDFDPVYLAAVAG